MRTYAIGDIHGQLERLKEAHARIEADRAKTGYATAPVIHVGDLVDRGPDSAGVVEYLRQGIAEGAPWMVLKGNHDRMFTGFLDDKGYQDPGLRSELSWLNPRLGGAETLASYGVKNAGTRWRGAVHREAVAAVPDEYIDQGALIGPADRIRSRLDAWLRSGATGLTLHGADEAAMRLIADYVG